MEARHNDSTMIMGSAQLVLTAILVWRLDSGVESGTVGSEASVCVWRWSLGSGSGRTLVVNEGGAR